jgi:hypothetical protein
MQSSPTKAELILARFPGPVTLYSSRKKWFSLLLICGLIGAGGLAMVHYGISDGWFLLVVFGALTIISLGMLLPGASALTLDGLGFDVTKFFRSHRARWQDVKRFDTFELHRSRPTWLVAAEKMVIYDDVRATSGILATVNKTLADHNAFLPDTYGLKGEELAWLMTQWRERVAGRLQT